MPSMLQRVKAFLRALALDIPGGTSAYRSCTAALGHWRLRRMFPDLTSATDAADVFDHFYRTNAWGVAESVSGMGSTPA